ncbi:hypothetical protein ABW19_dt0210187 [Dactylella cylindrospora]|nr:hypothetical protein ABW19_dt0210187 [Dactylella cylindrospora]
MQHHSHEARYLQERTEAYEKVLENLYSSGHLDNNAKLVIANVLKESTNWGKISQSLRHHEDDSRHGASVQDVSRGLMLLDKVTDDFGGTSFDFPHGYLGRSSDMSWLQTIIDGGTYTTTEDVPQTHRDNRRKGKTPEYPDAPASAEGLDYRQYSGDGPRSYHLDDLAPFIPLPHAEDAFKVPDRHTADPLVESFFNTIHLAFPIIFKPQFLKEYYAFMNDRILVQPIRTWLASLNVIFAIGSFHSNLINATGKEATSDHLTYLARAQALFFNGSILFNNPDRRQVQALGLLGIYLLATKQINRCWNVVGLAIRNGYSLGLHLSSDLTRLDQVQQEIRHRKWYSLMALERLCGILSGRPPYMDERRYHIPALSGIDEDTLNEILENAPKDAGQPLGEHDRELDKLSPKQETMPRLDNSDGFFAQSTKLYQICLEILNKMYCAKAVKLTWADVETIITTTTAKLEKWRNDIPMILAPAPESHEEDLQIQRKPPADFAETNPEQRDDQQHHRQDLDLIGHHPNILFGSSDLLGGPTRGMQGLDSIVGGTTGAGEYSDSSHQISLGVPGINILARTGFDNIGLLSGYPSQTVTDDAEPIDPMQLESTDPQLWNWQNFPVQPPHESGEQQVHAQGFTSQMYPIASNYAPGYPVYSDSAEGYPASEAGQDFPHSPGPS